MCKGVKGWELMLTLMWEGCVWEVEGGEVSGPALKDRCAAVQLCDVLLLPRGARITCQGQSNGGVCEGGTQEGTIVSEPHTLSLSLPLSLSLSLSDRPVSLLRSLSPSLSLSPSRSPSRPECERVSESEGMPVSVSEHVSGREHACEHE